MPITLTVNSIPYEYPVQGEQPPYGEQATGWAEQVTSVLNSLKGPADILETGANIANNQSTPVDVTDLKFDPSIVRSFTITGSCTRVADSATYYEEFTLTGLKKDSDWDIQQEGIGDTQVVFSITAGGQVQYTSSNLSFTTTYSGLVKFKAIGVLQA